MRVDQFRVVSLDSVARSGGIRITYRLLKIRLGVCWWYGLGPKETNRQFLRLSSECKTLMPRRRTNGIDLRSRDQGQISLAEAEAGISWCIVAGARRRSRHADQGITSVTIKSSSNIGSRSATHPTR